MNDDYPRPYALPRLRLPFGADPQTLFPARCHWCGDWCTDGLPCDGYERWEHGGTGARGLMVLWVRIQCRECCVWLWWERQK
jgi:hypothetical protein